jgi:hypothetical protein
MALVYLAINDLFELRVGDRYDVRFASVADVTL